MGSTEEFEATVRQLIAGDEAAEKAYEERRAELGPDVFIPLLRRILLQVIDAFWLEHLDTMEYMRRSVSLRAYGQRDPLIEYRKEGLARFRDMEAGVAQSFRDALPHIHVADDSRIREEEAKTRRALVAASEGGDNSEAGTPIVKGDTYGRNDLVTIRKGEETQTVKYKKAEPLLDEGWEIVRG
jgi:preprotein translocase subunit SecA